MDKTAPLTSETKVEPKIEAKVEPKVEPKPDDGKTLLSKEEPKKADAPVVPEKYEFKPPEGIKLDDTAIASASAIFKDLGLSQEQATKLFDFHVGQLKSASEAPFNLMNDQRAKWRGEIAADKDIGGKLETDVKPVVSKAIDSLGPELARDFRAAMDLTGVGDNPAFIKAFYNFAQRLGEGKHVSGSGPSKFGQTKPGDKPTIAGALYPNLA